MKKKILEVISTSVEHIIHANRLGVDRIELCSALSADGLSPSCGVVEWAVKHSDVPIMVMIRPREGNFVYSEPELEIMKSEIQWAKKCGANGVVLGVLTEKNEVNFSALKSLVNEAYPMDVTFHRAIDVVNDPLRSLEEIIEAGCTRVLTSGQQSSCIEGKSLIREMQNVSEGRIIIMAGAGINADTIDNIKCDEICEYHMSGLVRSEISGRQEEMFGAGMETRYSDVGLVLEKLRA